MPLNWIHEQATLHYYSYYYYYSLFVMMVRLYRMNRALKLFSGVFIIPALQVFWVLFAILGEEEEEGLTI